MIKIVIRMELFRFMTVGLDRRDIHIVKSNTSRVLLYYAEDYIKGMPKVFRHCEIIRNILRLRVRVTKSSKEYY